MEAEKTTPSAVIQPIKIFPTGSAPEPPNNQSKIIQQANSKWVLGKSEVEATAVRNGKTRGRRIEYTALEAISEIREQLIRT